LDTDDTAYLNFGSGSHFTEYTYSSAPYMNKWIVLRIQVVGGQVKFFADNGSGPQLLKTWPVTAMSPPDAYNLFFGASSVCWKSGPNDTSFRSIIATGTELPVYDVVREFSIASNPSGQWSYGYKTSVTGALTRHVSMALDTPIGVDRWYTTGQVLGVSRNKSGYPVAGNTYVFPTDQIHMHPTGPNIFSIVRWTVPSSGQYRIEGVFCGLDEIVYSADTDVRVLLNSSTELAPVVVLRGIGTQSPFAITRTLTVGDIIDFAVGLGPSGFQSNDSVGLTATMTRIP
jgi:hypothetical protein